MLMLALGFAGFAGEWKKVVHTDTPVDIVVVDDVVEVDPVVVLVVDDGVGVVPVFEELVHEKDLARMGELVAVQNTAVAVVAVGVDG